MKSLTHRDTSPISLVGTDLDDNHVYGLICLSNGPPAVQNYDPYGYKAEGDKAPIMEDWDQWVKKNYEIKELSVGFLCVFECFLYHNGI